MDAVVDTGSHNSVDKGGRLSRYTAAQCDLTIVASMVLGYFVLATYLELSEKVARFAADYEYLQFDELPLTLLFLTGGLFWFALRRAGEARRELVERVRAEGRITELLNHNRDLTQRMILVQENERRVLARELHDEVGQNCTAIRAEASYIMHASVSANVEASAQRIEQTAETLYAMAKNMLQRLRPPALDSLGLESALQELCETWEGQSGIACGFFPGDVPAQISDSTSIAIFRVIQEALTNVTRHAEATQVRISLHPAAGGRLNLIIEDNGRGMTHSDESHRGYGLIGMRERVAALQGDIRFYSDSGSGMRIIVELPLEVPAS
jgi:glucose-6-phosphate-specific signal transduction histidine kinase